MNSTNWSRFAARPILVGGLMVLLAACSGGGGAPATTTTSTTTTATTAILTTTATPTSTTSTTTTSTPMAPLPDNAADYAAAAFEAWKSGQLDRLHQLMTDDAYQVLASRAPSGDDQWSSAQCDGAAGSTYCQWHGAVDDLVLRVNNQAASLGDPQAVIEARFQ